MGDAYPVEVDTLDILKAKITKAVKDNGITSDVAEVVIIEPPELKGEHFATETVYAKIHFKDPSVKEKNLFVKKFSSNPLHTEMVKEMKFMEKEAGFFQKFLPFIRNFCKRFPGCEELLDFFPICFYADDDCVIMENLVLDKEYIMLDKEEQQDYQTAKMVVTNLAKFHAANFALIEDMGREEFRKKFALQIKESFDFSETAPMAPMFDNGVVTCMKILTGNPVPGSTETIEKLGALIGKMLPQLRELVTSSEAQPLLVLNHGDCWNNNLLFKKHPKTGQVYDQIFVDLQITRYGSPCLDLGYYFLTSIKPEVRRVHYKDLLKIYYDQFVETSKLMENKCPITFEELLVDFKRCAKLGYITSLSMQSSIVALKDIDINEMETDPAKMMEAFNRIVANWIDRNPDKATQIAQNLVLFVQDFEDLQRK